MKPVTNSFLCQQFLGRRLIETTKTLKRNIGKQALKPKSLQSFAPDVKTPSFGEPPIFVSKSLDRPIKSSHSMFGHIAFGSNLPSFQTIGSVVSNGTSKLLRESPLFFYVCKEIDSVSNDVPSVLSAVGLGELKYSPPKCYGKDYDKRKSYVHSKSAVTLEETHFDEGFGKIEWEQEDH